MNITTTLKPVVSWKAFSRGIPQEIQDAFPEGAHILHQDVCIFSYEDERVVSADYQDLLIPALQAILGDDPKECLHRELVDHTFFFKGKRYRLGYIHDPEEHDYGWYITAL
ncbi:MAG: hypothetical protein QG585_2 [Patescibacteria group bacterium]|nr:hypothetical protein [Patescibacteria group bacterium]